MELKATPKSTDDVLRLQRKYVIPRFLMNIIAEN